MKKLFFISLICLFSTVTFAQNEAELPLNDSLYNSIEESNELLFGESQNGTKKTTHSLRKFCPPAMPKVQPIGGLQWSFAVTQAMSIQYSEMNGSVMSSDEQFSSQFLYDLLPKTPNSCQLEKTWVQDTKEILETIGTISIKDYPVQSVSCTRKPNQKQIQKARRYCVRSFNKLFKTGSGDNEMSLNGKISIITGCLDRNHPVILCLKTDNQFSVLKSEIWKPTFSSATTNQTIIIIGYDKNLNLFEVAGLRGNEWGKQGFARIRFTDLIYAFYGFEIVMNQAATRPRPIQETKIVETRIKPLREPVIKPAPVSDNAFLSGELLLKEVIDYDKYRDARMKYEKEGYFEPIKSYGLQSQFQLVSQKMQKGSYVYVFSIDPKGKAEIHYPYEWQTKTADKYGLSIKPISPAVPAEATQIVIPKPRIESDPNGNSKRIEQALFKEEAGTDWLVVLYSDQRLENELNELVGKLTHTNFNEKFREVFGKRLIPQKEVKFDETRFKANSHHGYIVPIIIKLTAY